MKIMNILMAVNRNYLAQMRTLICSIGDNNCSRVDIYLIHNELNKNEVLETAELLKRKCDGALYEIKVSEKFLEGAKVNEHFSVEMYYRIFATELLPKELDRILWLDADIVTIKSLESLYNLDLQGNSIAACGHREKDKGVMLINSAACQRLKLEDDSIYFNSGVLLMDLNKIRKIFNKSATLDLIYKMESVLENPDQDILNIMYQHDVLILDESIYNYQVHYDWESLNEKDRVQEETVILHYVGPAKPWIPTTYHFTYEYYWKYYLEYGYKKVYKNYKVKLVCNNAIKKVKTALKRTVRRFIKKINRLEESI